MCAGHHIPKHRSIVISLLTAFLIAVLGAAEPLAASCSQRCTKPVPKPEFVEIDANSCQVLQGSTTFAERERVQVIVSGKNPFKHAYRTQIVASPLETNLIGSFLALVPGFAGISSIAGTSQVIGGTPAGVAGGPSCPGQENVWNEIVRLSDALARSDAELKVLAQPKVDAYKAYQDFVQTTDRESLGGDCAAICADAESVERNLGELIDAAALADLKRKAEKLAGSATALRAKVDDFKKNMGQDCDVEVDLAIVENNIAKTSKASQGILSNVTELEKAKSSIENFGKIIRRALADDRAFFEEHFPYTQAGPTGVKITCFRKNLREDNGQEKQVGQVDLTVGQSRFSITGGFGFSTIEDVTIVKQGDKFVDENESDLRPTFFTIMLNSRLGKLTDGISWGIAAGLALTPQENSTETEFILGPSFGFLDDRMFFSLGYHTARVQTLRSKDIPAGTTEIPVDKDWESGAMLALTFRIR